MFAASMAPCSAVIVTDFHGVAGPQQKRRAAKAARLTARADGYRRLLSAVYLPEVAVAAAVCCLFALGMLT